MGSHKRTLEIKSSFSLKQTKILAVIKMN